MRNTTEREMLISSINDQIKISQEYAHYWRAMATTGAVKSKKLYHGTSSELTDEEKIEYALSTSKNHIQRIVELVEEKQKLLIEQLSSGRIKYYDS